MGERVGHTAAVDCTCHLGKATIFDLVLLFPVANANQTQSQVWLPENIPIVVGSCITELGACHSITPYPPCRSAWRRLAPFLPAWSTRYIEPGNSAALLARAERQLGQPLPFEFWELYRFQSGQALHNMVGVQFIDGLRFVRCGEHA